MDGVLQELQIALARVVRQVAFLHLLDQHFADVDRRDALRALRQRRVDRLHDEARGDAAQALGLGVLAQLALVDALGVTLLDHLLAVVQLELGHQVALGARLQPREQGELVGSQPGHGGALVIVDGARRELEDFRRREDLGCPEGHTDKNSD